jgi:putative ABC transport system permease protein
MIEDPLLFLSQPDSILLTEAFAQRRGLDIGSSIVIETPSGQRSFTVRGLLRPEGVARVYGGNIAVLDLYAAERAFTRPSFINKVDIVLTKDADVAAVRGDVARIIPEGLSVQSPAQRKADLQRVMASMRLVLRSVSMVGLLAAFLIAFNRLSTVFEARVWQVGVMRAVGVRRLTAWRELTKEGLLLGMGGVILGLPSGIALGWLVLPIIATTTALNYKLIAPAVTLGVHPTAVATAMILGFATALFAAGVPAWRAATQPAGQVVRTRGREQGGGLPAKITYIRYGLAFLLVAALVMQFTSKSSSWGLVATALMAVGTALSARPILDLVKSPVAAALSLSAGASGRLAAVMMFRNRRRAALTLGMLGVGLGSMFWLWTVAHSFQRSVIKALGSAFAADLIVTSSRIVSGFDGAPIGEDVVDEVSQLNGVVAAVGERIVDWHYAGGPIAIDAFDPAYFETTRFGRWKLVARSQSHVWRDVAAGQAVIVSSSFVHNVGAGVGDMLMLETPSGYLKMAIAGVTVAFASPRGTIEMSREVYETYWRDSTVTRIHLATGDAISAADVRAAIAERFGRRYRLQVLSAGELLDYWAVQVRRAFAFLNILAILVLVVILLGMADTLAAGVADRMRELGVMRAVGVRRRNVRLIVVLEAITLGLIGIALGGAAGVALGALWVKGTFPQLLGWALEFHFPYAQGVLAAVLTLGVCVVAAALPARQAARLEPAAALRYE